MSVTDDHSGAFVYESFPGNQNLSPVARALKERQIPHRFVLAGNMQQLVLLHQEDIAEVRAILSAWEQGELQGLNAPRSDDQQALSPTQKPAPLTLGLVFLGCVGAALAAFGQDFIQLFTFWDPRHRVYFAITGVDPWIDIRAGEFWRLISPVFLHFGPIHLVFNALWVWFLGTIIERAQGKAILLLLVLAIATISNSTQALFSGSAIFGGLSGVVYGLFAYTWLWGKLQPASGVGLPDVLFVIITVLMLLGPLGVFDIIVGAEIADAAHISGYLSGAVLALLFYFLKKTGISFGSG